jgi:exopolysaccharide production protein ExoQ
MSLVWGRFRPWHILAGVGFLAPLMALVTPLGMAPFSALAAILALSLAWRERPWRRIDPRPFQVLAALLFWSLVTVAWTLEPFQALKTWSGAVAELAGAAILIGVAAGLPREEARRIGLLLAVGVSLALGVMLLEIFTDGLLQHVLKFNSVNPVEINSLVLSRLSRGQTVTTIFALPAILATWRDGRRLWAIAMTVSLVVVTIGGHPLALRLALPLALLAMLAMAFRPRPAVPVMAAIITLMVAAAPLLSLMPSPQVTMDATETWLPRSAHHRLTIWTFGAKRILEKPVAGWGLDASRAIPGGDDTVPVSVTSPRYGNYVLQLAQMPLHPHNVAIQSWLELGAVGAALVIATIITILRRAGASADAGYRGAAAGLLTVVVTVDLVSYGMWQSWWLCSIGLATMMLVAAKIDKTGKIQ